MKKTFFISLMFVSSFCFAQNRMNKWLLGYNTGLSVDYRPSLIYVGGIMDTLTMNPYPMDFSYTCAMICDTTGQLLFYTNGQWIANRNNDTLLGSKNFNPGYATNVFYLKGLGIPQAVVIIPKPSNDSLYSLFHLTFDQLSNGTTSPLHLSYSEINIKRDSGKGEMILKNKAMIFDTLVQGRLTACKHANGRDWWVISHEYSTNRYYKFLLTPDSIYGPYSQNIGQSIVYDYGSQSCFSPDGNWYATVSDHDGALDIMKFNRCTGDFYDCVSTNLQVDSNFFWNGIAFSPNCKFLYVNSRLSILQYDLQYSNILTSESEVGHWDYYCENILGCTYFAYLQLAPDNKIYLSTVPTTKYIHRIANPDSTICNFIQRYYQFVNYNRTIPNFPNYDLGPLAGNGCDTIDNPIDTIFKFTLYPNPAGAQLNITFNVESESKLKVYDVLGREALEFTLYPWFKSNIIDVSMLPSGLYLYEVSDAGKRLKQGKFVKVRAN